MGSGREAEEGVGEAHTQGREIRTEKVQVDQNDDGSITLRSS